MYLPDYIPVSLSVDGRLVKDPMFVCTVLNLRRSVWAEGWGIHGCGSSGPRMARGDDDGRERHATHTQCSAVVNTPVNTGYRVQ